MTFDSRTAYVEDWQYLDRVLDATLTTAYGLTPVKVQRQDITQPAILEIAGQLGMTTEETLFRIWPISPADSTKLLHPKSGDHLTVEETLLGNTDKQLWVIQSALRSELGLCWLATVRRGYG